MNGRKKLSRKRILAILLVLVVFFTNCITGNMTEVQAATKIPTKLMLNYKKADLSVGSSIKLSVKTVKPKGASKKVSWKSSNTKIATVTSSGKVKAKKNGSVTISAKSKTNPKVMAKCKIKVYKATKKVKLLSNKAYTLKTGEKVALKAKVTKPKKGAQPIQWSSKNKKIAKVDNKGNVTAVSVGKTDIIGKSGKKKVVVKITVKAIEEEKPIQEPELAPDTTLNPEPDTTPDPAPDTTPDPAPDTTPDPAPDTTPDLAPDTTPEPKPNPEEEGSEEEKVINRAEWIAALVDMMGYAITEENLTKDAVTGNILYTYDDISDNPNVLKIEAAVQSGILPVEMNAEEQNYLFHPEGVVTREFAAMTAVQALGYVTDTSLECSDAADLKYPMQDKAAVDAGMLALLDGAFVPEAQLLEEEKQQIFKVISEILENRQIDEAHEDVIVYTEAVVEKSAELTEYTVSATEDGKLSVTMPKNSITENLSANQILLLPANELYIDGLPLKIESVITQESTVVATGMIPTDASEVFEKVELQGIGQIDEANIVLAEGVTCIENSTTFVLARGIDESGKFDVGFEKTYEVTMPEEVEADGEVTASITLEIPEIRYIFDFNKSDVNQIMLEVPNTISADFDGQAEWSGSKKLGKFPVKLPAGFVVNIIVSVVMGVDGSVHVSYTLDNTFGVDYTKASGLKVIKSMDKSWEAELDANANLGMNLAIELSWADGVRNAIRDFFGAEADAKPIYTIGMEGGVGANANSITRSDRELTCTDVSVWLYFDLFVGEHKDGTLLTMLVPELEHRWEIFSQENSPLMAGIHFENLKKVEKCTYTVGEYVITVVDADGKPIEGANLTLRSNTGETFIAKTDASGTVSGDNAEGNYAMSVVFAEYKSYAGTMRLNNGETTKCRIILIKAEEEEESSGEEVLPIKYSGEWNGLSWYITEAGTLVVSGNYEKNETENEQNPEWLQYKNEISCAIVTATSVKSTWNWFLGCSAMTSVDFSRFDTSSVTSMRNMFYECSALTSLDLSGFDTSNVKDMGTMFGRCNNLASLNLSGWNTSKVTDMSGMFSECDALTGLDLSGFDTSSVTNIDGMFYESGLTSIDLRGFDVGSVIDMSHIFSRCNSLTSIDLSGWNAGSAIDMSYMFYDCNKLISLDLSGFNTSSASNMSYMFYNCRSLTSLDVSGFDTGSVVDMSYMFYDCNGLTSLDVSDFDTSSVTNMSEMFSECDFLTSLDVSGFVTSNVTDMSGMFGACNGLTSLDVSGFDTSKVTDMNHMFAGCRNLQSVNVSGFDTDSVTDMSYMFGNCMDLIRLDLSSFDMRLVTKAEGMLPYYLSELRVIKVPLNVNVFVDLEQNWQDPTGAVGSCLPYGVTESFEITRM